MIKVLDGQGNFEEINLRSFFPIPADAWNIAQHRKDDRMYIMGLWNQQTIEPDGSYLSNQSYSQSLLGDFSYNPSTENHVYVLDDDYFLFKDYDSAKTVFYYPVVPSLRWTSHRGLITTPNDNFVIMFSSAHTYGDHSSPIFCETEMFK